MSKRSSGSSKEAKQQDHYIQDVIGIDRIIDNVVFMSDGTVCGILEILPLNFYHKNYHERNKIIANFERIFKVCPDNIHIKIRSEDTNITKTLNHITECMAKESDPVLREQAKDYVQHIKRIQGTKTLCQKFYFIYEYTGDSKGVKSNNLETILREMFTVKNIITTRIQACGNIVVMPTDNFSHVCDILYRYFNPISSITESVLSRDMRINMDRETFNSYLPKKMARAKDVADIILPRSLDLTHTSYLVMDGQYHTFISLRDNGYPTAVYGAWTDAFTKGKGIDIDIIMRKIPRETALSILPQAGRITGAMAILKRNNPDKYEDMKASEANIHNITQRMKKGDEDLWDTFIVITIRANSYKDMMQKKEMVVSNLQSQSMYVNDSFTTVPQYFRYTLPLISNDTNMFTSVFARDKHNFLTSSAASLYCFTAYELFDEKGYVMGTNDDNASLVAINNFNTERYSNGNILLIGTSGSGKTFTETMLGYRMRMSGIRVIYILPVKGYEDHWNSCKNINGAFITLSPSSKNCINIMAIRPAAHVKVQGIAPLLSQKITSIDVFVKLLMGNRETMTIEEENELTEVLVKLYADFGINNDNESIWKDKTHTALKDMPTLGDLYARLRRRPTMKRIASVVSLTVTGDCRSLNGQTNVDLTNKYICFDVDSSYIKERLYPAFLYIAFDCAYGMAKESDQNFDAIFLDEVWKMMVNESCAKQVMEMVKLIRAYAGCAVIATQDIEDFLGKTHGFGKSVITNTKLKILLNMEDEEIEMVAEHMRLTREDKDTIMKLKHQALLYSNGDKVLCNLIASDREIRALTTDANLKKMYAEEDRRKEERKREIEKSMRARKVPSGTVRTVQSGKQINRSRKQ